MEQSWKSPDKKLQAPLIALTFIASLIFAFFGIISRSVWLDEACAVFVANRDFLSILPALHNDSGPPLYYFSLSAWIKLFGISELSVRSLSVVFYFLSIGAIYECGRTLIKSRQGGLIAALLFFASPLAIRHATNTRSYELMSLWVILSISWFLRIFFFAADSENTKKSHIFFILANIGGTFTHYWFFFALFGELVACLALFPFSQIKKCIALMTLSFLPFSCIWLPTLLTQKKVIGTIWISKPTLRFIPDTILDFYGANSAIAGTAALISFATLILCKISNGRPLKISTHPFAELKKFFKQRIILVLTIIFSTLLFVPFFVSYYYPMYVVGRYTIATLPPFVLLLTACIYRFANPRFTIIFFCFLVTGVALSCIIRRINPGISSDRRVADYLMRNAQEGDAIIFTSLTQGAIEYYFTLRKNKKNFIKASFPLETSSHMGFFDEQKFLRKKSDLEREAISTADHLKATLSTRSRIWLLYGDSNRDISDILISRLEENFSRENIFSNYLVTPFSKTIYTYQNKTGPMKAPLEISHDQSMHGCLLCGFRKESAVEMRVEARNNDSSYLEIAKPVLAVIEREDDVLKFYPDQAMETLIKVGAGQIKSDSSQNFLPLRVKIATQDVILSLKEGQAKSIEFDTKGESQSSHIRLTFSVKGKI